MNTITPHQRTSQHLILFPNFMILYCYHSIAFSFGLHVSQLFCLSVTLISSPHSTELFHLHLATIHGCCDVTVSPPLVRCPLRTSTGLVLATVVDCRFRSGSRSKLNHCQLGCPGRECTRSVNSNIVFD